MEPLSISLGILQLIGCTGNAIKISSLIYKKLKIFRNYSREVGRVLKGVDRQRKNFLHEVHLFLRQAQADEGDIEQMLEDAEHPRWKSNELQLGMDAAFGKSLSTYQDIIEEIISTLRSLQVELCCFDEIVGMCNKNEPLKDAVRRLRKKIKIAWDKPKFEEQINILRELTGDFRRLREQAAEIKEPNRTVSSSATRSAKQLPKEYGSITKVKRASEALHQALAAAWLRSLDTTLTRELRHNVKLLLNTQAEDEVRMEVAITCYGHCLGQQLPDQLGFIRLHVESKLLDFTETEVNTLPDGRDSGRKRRKVHFAGDVNYTLNEPTITALTRQGTQSIDLCNAQDICAVLFTKDAACRAPKCVGYIDNCVNETFRHSFFQTPESMRSEIIPGSPSVSMNDILCHPVENSVTFIDQLKLARDFVMAVLKFHSTPWLREGFSLQDLFFFPSREGNISHCLQTAHLAFNFAQNVQDNDSAIVMDDASDEEAVENAKLTYGVRNLTLWRLGAILLQIGTWTTIGSVEDVVNVRRLAQRTPMLGKRYKNLTRQCLECDFAFGDDLSKPRLQQAVYENVVGGLTEMISSLDIDDE